MTIVIGGLERTEEEIKILGNTTINQLVFWQQLNARPIEWLEC